jgi:hypothetical protein
MLAGKTVRHDRKHRRPAGADGDGWLNSVDTQPEAEAEVQAQNELLAKMGLDHAYHVRTETYQVSVVAGRGARGRLAHQLQTVYGIYVRPWQTAPEGWRDQAAAG